MIVQSVPGARLGRGREFDRIREILADAAAAPSSEVRVGPGDDALVLADGLVISTDLAVEDVHFRLDWMSAEEAGYRAAAGGMSDLAAMAAEPIGVLASVAVPGDGDLAVELMRGVKTLAREMGTLLLGGDLTRAPDRCVIDVVSVGRAERPLLRSAARAGDELWVTGSLGGAAAAVRLLREGGRGIDRRGSGGAPPARVLPAALRARLVAPRPRLAEARWLSEAGVRCGLDLSDGLTGDAGHIAAASGVGVVLEAAAVPVDAAVAEARGLDQDGLELALHGGEDYELLLAAPPALLAGRVEEFSARFDLSLTRVGRVVDGSGVSILVQGEETPRPLERGGYDHFGGEREP